MYYIQNVNLILQEECESHRKKNLFSVKSRRFPGDPLSLGQEFLRTNLSNPFGTLARMYTVSLSCGSALRPPLVSAAPFPTGFDLQDVSEADSVPILLQTFDHSTRLLLPDDRGPCESPLVQNPGWIVSAPVLFWNVLSGIRV